MKSSMGTSLQARLGGLRKDGWHGRQSAGAVRREEKLRQRRRRLKTLATIAGVVILGMAVSHTQVVRKAWAAMAVFDASNLIKNAETAANTIQLLTKTSSLLTETEQVKSLTTDVKRNIGTGANLVDAALTTPRNSPGSALGRSVSVVSAIPDMKKFGIDTSVGSADAQTVIAAVKKGISLDGATSSTSRYSTVETNRKAARAAVEEAYGLALQNRYTAAETPKKLESLMAAAKAAAGEGGDLRSQILVLSSLVGLDIEEKVQARALDASYVQAMMAERVATDTGFLGKEVPTSSPPGGQPAASGNNDLWGK